ESSSISSSAGKNGDRCVASTNKLSKKLVDRRGDLIIRKVAGKTYEGENDTKLLCE
ncbi:1634_t:CDS:1, partial [Entrophospora sp. SA101]